MTTKQLVELLYGCGVTNIWGYSDALIGLQEIAPSLARRVIAADRLLSILDEVSIHDLDSRDLLKLIPAIEAYREAT